MASRVDDVTQRAIDRLGVPAESRRVEVNGFHLHTVVAGPDDGPLVVLLHGFPECWYAWHKQIAPLAQAGYRVIAPDQLGYNLSDRPSGVTNYRLDPLAADVRELIHAFDREHAIVIGHDWGGVVAWHFARLYPEWLDKLIVLNAPYPSAMARALRRNPRQRRKSWYMFFFQLPWLPETLMGLAPYATARRLFRGAAVRKNAFDDDDLEVLATSIGQPGAPQAMINWYRAAFRYRSAVRARSPIETPTLLIWAEEDVALDKSLTLGLEKWVPRLQVQYMPQCGHWVQNEAADEVNAQLLAFMPPAR